MIVFIPGAGNGAYDEDAPLARSLEQLGNDLGMVADDIRG